MGNAIISYGTEALILKKKDLNKLDSIQYNAIRNLFAMPWATPKGILRYELGLIPIDLNIKGRQFEFIHIKKNSSMNNMQKEAIFSIPYWIKTYDSIKNDLNLHHCEDDTKETEIKRIIKIAILLKNEENIINNTQSKTQWYNEKRQNNGRHN